jgi:hypothetical protein
LSMAKIVGSAISSGASSDNCVPRARWCLHGPRGCVVRPNLRRILHHGCETRRPHRHTAEIGAGPR